MSDHPHKYNYSIPPPNNQGPTVELELSDISEDPSPKKTNHKHKKIQKQSKLDVFMERIKTRKQVEANQTQQDKQLTYSKLHGNNGLQKQEYPPKQWDKKQKNKNKLQEKIDKMQSRKKQSASQVAPIYTRNMDKQKQKLYEEILKKKIEQKKAKKLQQMQQKKKKEEIRLEAERKRKKAGINAFFDGVIGDDDQDNDKVVCRQKINHLDMFNSFQAEKEKGMIQDVNGEHKLEQNRNNTGLIYRKQKIEREKMPISFLKMLLSYRFSAVLPIPQTKRVPNVFSDQLTYKKVFHYLVTNQCIADIHARIVKIEQNKQSTIIPICIGTFKKQENGFIKLSLRQFDKKGMVVSSKTTQNEIKKLQKQKKQSIKNQKGQQKNERQQENIKQKQKKNMQQKFMLKNLSLSRNRLGLITNAKNFKIDHYGMPSKKNDKIFGFLCMLSTPQSKQQLYGDVEALASFDTPNLEMIMKLNNSNKAFFIDLQKISTHLRQFLAITHLYDTEVASFIYNPPLIEKHQFDMISETQRELLNPILNTLKQFYNQTQFQSIREMVLRDSGIVLLQGPPGTGKTTTLMGLLAAEYQYLRNIFTGDEDKRKIMICAPSNAAVDLITKRLVCQGLITHRGDENVSISFLSNASHKSEQNQNQDVLQEKGPKRVFPKILRVGIVESTDPDILSVALDDICDRQALRVRDKIIKKNNMTTTQVKEKMISISKEINRLNSKKGLSEMEYEYKVNSLRNQMKRYETLLYNFRKEKVQLKQTYAQIEKRLFEQADIVLTTLSSSGSERLERLMGSVGSLIVDEAAQATQPNLLIPFQTGVRKVLLIGDPCQLPSTTLSQDSSMTLFNRSLFERFLDSGVKPYFLNIQYRMAPQIRQFPSQAFYAGRLKDAQCIKNRYQMQVCQKSVKQPIESISQFYGRHSIFLDIKFGEQQFHQNSYRNIGQCIVIKQLVMHFIKNTTLSIGVITPYQAQRRYLLKQLKKQIAEILKSQMSQNEERQSDMKKEVEEGQFEGQNKQDQGAINLIKKKQPEEVLQERVMVNTVDSFQGQEKDIIIVSTVRANQRKDIGFMKDQRRVNVALTRSKHLLIVVGHGDTLGSNQTWNSYCEWAEKNKVYYIMKKRQNMHLVFEKMHKGFNNQLVYRKTYNKLTKDNRKQQRAEIQREDFGLGAAKKKVKKEKVSIMERMLAEPIKSEQKVVQKKEEKEIMQKMQDEKILDQQMQAQLIQQKIAKESEIANFQQMNRRMKQMEEKLAKNSAWSQLFK